MTDIVAFISARLDEDQAAAEAWDEAERTWQQVGARNLRYDNGSGERVQSIDTGGGYGLLNEQIWVKHDYDGERTAHIARHDPARVLREVAAKREVIEDWRTYADRNKRDDSDEAAGSAWAALSNVLVTLAGMHREHPDYAGDNVDDWTWPDDDPAWRVE